MYVSGTYALCIFQRILLGEDMIDDILTQKVRLLLKRRCV